MCMIGFALSAAAAALVPLPSLRPASNTRVRALRPALCAIGRGGGAASSDAGREDVPPSPSTTWAEELAREPDEVSQLGTSRSAAGEFTVVDVEGDVGGFIEQFAALTRAAAKAEEQAEEEGFVVPTILSSSQQKLDETAKGETAAASPFLGQKFIGSWPISDHRGNPEVGGQRGLGAIQWGHGLREDLKRRLPVYASDWTDGFNPKSLAAIAFLWFACLAPVLAFGGAMSVTTQGAMGVPEVILSRGVCGMVHACVSGQPMTFLGPTGLTLAFTTSLYAYCTALSLPFLPMYAWVGLWTSAILLVSAFANLSGLIRWCTRFTEDVFNALLASNSVGRTRQNTLAKQRDSHHWDAQPTPCQRLVPAAVRNARAGAHREASGAPPPSLASALLAARPCVSRDDSAAPSRVSNLQRVDLRPSTTSPRRCARSEEASPTRTTWARGCSRSTPP